MWGTVGRGCGGKGDVWGSWVKFALVAWWQASDQPHPHMGGPNWHVVYTTSSRLSAMSECRLGPYVFCSRFRQAGLNGARQSGRRCNRACRRYLQAVGKPLGVRFPDRIRHLKRYDGMVRRPPPPLSFRCTHARTHCSEFRLIANRNSDGLTAYVMQNFSGAAQMQQAQSGNAFRHRPMPWQPSLPRLV